jgi:hypothetical protein
MQKAKKVAPWDDPTGATDGAAVAAGITMYSADGAERIAARHVLQLGGEGLGLLSCRGGDVGALIGRGNGHGRPRTTFVSLGAQGVTSVLAPRQCGCLN